MNETLDPKLSQQWTWRFCLLGWDNMQTGGMLPTLWKSYQQIRRWDSSTLTLD